MFHLRKPFALLAGVLCAWPSSMYAANIVLVAGSTALNTADDAVYSRLVSNGHSVTVIDDDAATGSEGSGNNLVILSSTVDALKVAAKFKTTTTPVITWDDPIFDDMGLTDTTGRGTDAGASVAIMNSSHPLAAGLTGTVTVYSASSRLTWGRPASGAASVASMPGTSTKVTIFGYDTGSAMFGLNAPARRVGFYLTDSSASISTVEGWRLFDAAVNWAMNTSGGTTNPAPTTSLTSPANGTTFAAPANIALNASATDSNGTVSKVDFYSGSSVISSDTSSPYAITWNGVFAGTYQLSARATDNGGAVGYSSNINVIVNNTGSGGEIHPRLFITSTRLNQIKTAIAVAGSTHQEAFNAMKARVDLNDWTVYDDSSTDANWNYARTWLAREAALMYLLTGNQTYAQNAYAALEACYTNPDPDKRQPDGGYSNASNALLARAMTGMGFAITYDWAYHGWTQAQRDFVRGKIKNALDLWPSWSHTNLGSPYTSNWVGVCRGGEFIMTLAVYEETARSSRYGSLKSWLNQHMANAYGPSGWCNEGNGYADFTGIFLVPAVLAARSVGDTGLDAQYNSRSFWRLCMAAFSSTFDPISSPNRLMLLTGVDGGGNLNSEGWSSALLGTIPSANQAQYKYFYDYYMGRNAPGTSAQRYDPRRAGTTWALIYYPESVTSANPSGSLNTLLDDSKGIYFFRKNWQNNADIHAHIMGDYKFDNPGWNTEEAFQIGLIAYGTRYIGGPGKGGTGSTAVSTQFSCLLVDGKAFYDGTKTGLKDTVASSANGSGYVIVDGGTKYSSLGLSSAKRHFLVDYSGKAGPGLISTLDRVTASASHQYTWQLNPGSEVNNGGVTLSNGSEGGRQYFLLRGANNGYVKGWVMNPSNATLTTGDPLKVVTSSANADIWVIMQVGTGTPPTGVVSGSGLGSTLTLGTAVIKYDTTTNRIVVQ